MANIYLNDEAYARLKAAKKEDESFSDWVMENAKPKINWKKFVGAWKDADTERMKAEIKKDRR